MKFSICSSSNSNLCSFYFRFIYIFGCFKRILFRFFAIFGLLQKKRKSKRNEPFTIRSAIKILLVKQKLYEKKCRGVFALHNFLVNQKEKKCARPATKTNRTKQKQKMVLQLFCFCFDQVQTGSFLVACNKNFNVILPKRIKKKCIRVSNNRNPYAFFAHWLNQRMNELISSDLILFFYGQNAVFTSVI